MAKDAPTGKEDHIILGFDIGGTGIKSALIDVKSGKLVTEKYKVLTPKPANPEAIRKVMYGIIKTKFPKYEGVIGCGFPAIIHDNIAMSAANIDDSWVGVNVKSLLEEKGDHKYFIANDADLAALAEARFGVARNKLGKIFVLTIGTGIGSGFIFNGELISNTELGHLYYKGDSYEKYISNVTRKSENLKWSEWGTRFNDYLHHLEIIFSPDLFVLGGGTSKKFAKFEEQITVRTPVIPAKFQNDAGVLGAAIYAAEQENKTS